MELATWWALFVALALIAGLVCGLVWRVFVANKGIGLGRLFTLTVLAVAIGISVLIVGGSITKEILDRTDSIVVVFVMPPAFWVVWLIGFRSVVNRRVRSGIRARRQVAVAGSHEVTRFLRRSISAATAPLPVPSIDDRPLPTPMVVGNRDVVLPPATLQAGVEDLRLPPPPPPAGR